MSNINDSTSDRIAELLKECNRVQVMLNDMNNEVAQMYIDMIELRYQLYDLGLMGGDNHE